MENFFDQQVYQIETGLQIFQLIVFLKMKSNDFMRCHLNLENTLLTLFEDCKERQILNTINIANSYLEFPIHVCMGRGVIIQQSSKQLQIFGLSPQILQILKLYGIQKDFVTQYKVIKQIGRGSFGKVYKVRNVQNKNLYAVKMFEKQLLLDFKDRQAIIKEIQILRLMNHPNVLSIIECFESEQCIFLVEELLDDHLQIDVGCRLKEEKAILILINSQTDQNMFIPKISYIEILNQIIFCLKVMVILLYQILDWQISIDLMEIIYFRNEEQMAIMLQK